MMHFHIQECFWKGKRKKKLKKKTKTHTQKGEIRSVLIRTKGTQLEKLQGSVLGMLYPIVVLSIRRIFRCQWGTEINLCSSLRHPCPKGQHLDIGHNHPFASSCSCMGNLILSASLTFSPSTIMWHFPHLITHETWHHVSLLAWTFSHCSFTSSFITAMTEGKLLAALAPLWVNDDVPRSFFYIY